MTITPVSEGNDMLTMASLAAQNQFGMLIDTSQRQPVAVTRRGRPVAVVMSYEDEQTTTQTIPLHVAKLIARNHPLRGKEAADAMRQTINSSLWPWMQVPASS